MLLRFDPFRDLDRLTEQVARAPHPLAMDAVRRGDDVLDLRLNRLPGGEGGGNHGGARVQH